MAFGFVLSLLYTLWLVVVISTYVVPSPQDVRARVFISISVVNILFHRRFSPAKYLV
jgi:hypothetical protein